MKPRNLTRLILIFLSIFSCSEAFPVSKPKLLKSTSSKDTTEVMQYTRTALKLASKPKNNIIVKANIDSAEHVCAENGIELPPLLYLARAWYFLRTNDYINASEEANVALRLANSKSDTEAMLKTMNFLGQYNLRIRFFQESIGYFNDAISLARKKKLNGYIPYNYLGISDAYRAMNDTIEVRNNLRMMIEEAMRESDSMLIQVGARTLGSSLIHNVRDFHGADSLLRLSLRIAEIRHDTAGIAFSLANLGFNFYLEKLFPQSIEYYNRALSYSIPARNYSNSANSLGNLGTIYRDLGQYNKSLSYYKKSIESAKRINDVYNLYWVYEDLNKLYLTQGDTAKAYESYVLFNKYHEAFLLNQNMQGLSESKIRFDAENHSKELQLLSLKLKNQKLLIYGYTGLFVLVLAIGILIISRAKINARHKISDMNRKIAEITQANLRQQMNPHFIFNTLNSIQYYMYQHDKLATNNYLTKFSSLMRKVLENSQHTSIPLRDELDALKLYLDLEMIRFKDKFNYEIKVDDEIDSLLYKVPAMLIQPYVENSISHGLMPSEEKGFLKINLKLENNHISCIIEDNGIGRDAAQEKKRNGNPNHNSLGTQIVASRLDLVNTLYGTSLKTIYTDLKNINGEPEGTRVELQIPIMT